MLGYLSADNICSEKRTVFRERSSRKTVSFEEQIMSKDQYPNIFSQPNWGYCVYYPSVLKTGEYPRIFPTFSWGIFAHVTRLDQSRASENIWWIINEYTLVYRKVIAVKLNTLRQHTTNASIENHNFSNEGVPLRTMLKTFQYPYYTTIVLWH